MGISERKNREKEERKALILEKAKALILEHGVEALSMQEIADRAELSKATLYLYFQSKEAILTEILDESATTFVEYVQARISPEDSGLGAIRTLWGSYLSLFGESQDIFVLTGIGNFIDPGFLLKVEDQEERGSTPRDLLLDMIDKVIERGVADGTLETRVAPAKLARSIVMIATAVIDAVARLPRSARDARLIRAEMRNIFELLLRGLAAEGTDRSLLILPE